MSRDHFVIIGNGPAGREAAVTLREKSPESRISLISSEQVGCYRSKELPGFIAGRFKEEELFVSPFQFYKDLDIKLRLGQKVVDIGFGKREVTLDHKEVIPFTGLIVAVGGKPHIPEPLFRFKAMFLTLKTLADAKVWTTRLAETHSVLLIGGDLTSVALAGALLDMGKQVLFVIDENALWPVRATHEVLDELSHFLHRRGIEVIDGSLTQLSRSPDGLYEAVVEGRKVKTGLVGAFFGLAPDVKFLAGSGLNIERGILVDEHLNTGIEGVYAAGDCAQVYHPVLRNYWVSIGQENAENLGRIAGANLAGGAIEAEARPESILESDGVKVNTSWWAEF